MTVIKYPDLFMKYYDYILKITTLLYKIMYIEFDDKIEDIIHIEKYIINYYIFYKNIIEHYKTYTYIPILSCMFELIHINHKDLEQNIIISKIESIISSNYEYIKSNMKTDSYINVYKYIYTRYDYLLDYFIYNYIFYLRDIYTDKILKLIIDFKKIINQKKEITRYKYLKYKSKYIKLKNL
jgi:hypothetical protein